MTRNDFIIKTIVAMAANSAYHYTWISGHEWAKKIVDAAILLADYMEKNRLINPDDG